MQMIQVLDHNTIDQIAAGEVVERPASIVKELVENSMDAGADAITVEIRDGGIELIRVTDNGCGIGEEDLSNAFLRHATSKIHDISDLERLHSMGFRGEALASIASVCKVTMITKRSDELMGHKMSVNGGVAEPPEEVGAPNGTTILAAHLFYNTPVRRKFLKSATSEGNQIQELMEHLALSRPDISYTFIAGGRTRFMTSGSGDLKDVIYRIYGRELSKAVVPVSFEKDGIRIDGYLGEPSMNRPNRNYENYFLNQRYIRSDVVARGIEEGYRGYTMQHKFPFCVLYITMDAGEIDVNVHPTKMDVRFHDREGFFDCISQAVADTLHSNEMIPRAVLEKPSSNRETIHAPEPFETGRRQEAFSPVPEDDKPLIASEEPHRPEDHAPDDENRLSHAAEFTIDFDDSTDEAQITVPEQINTGDMPAAEEVKPDDPARHISDSIPDYNGARQMEMLPKERVISVQARQKYRLIGCIFNTYWLFSYQDKLFFVDQHAAHEKVNFERLVEQYEKREVYSQRCDPPVIVSLTLSESETLEIYMDYFEEAGFHIEPFGGSEYAISQVPYELYRKNSKQLFMEILNELDMKGRFQNTPRIIDRVFATIACKAAVKGGDVISMQEMDAVLDELLTLKNPYHCPHGRPTIFSMSRAELERKFKRIV